MALDLLTGLVGHWRMDEASGNRADAYGINPFYAIRSVVSVSDGPLGLATGIRTSNQGYLQATDEYPLRGNNRTFTWAGWVRMIAYNGYEMVLTKGDLEYQLLRQGGSSALEYRLNGDFTRASVGLGNDAWHFVRFWQNVDAGEGGIRFDNDEPVTFALDPAGVETGHVVAFGMRGGAYFADCDLQAWSFWNRVLTEEEHNALYNEGYGLPFENFVQQPAFRLNDQATGTILGPDEPFDVTLTPGGSGTYTCVITNIGNAQGEIYSGEISPDAVIDSLPIGGLNPADSNAIQLLFPTNVLGVTLYTLIVHTDAGEAATTFRVSVGEPVPPLVAGVWPWQTYLNLLRMNASPLPRKRP